MQSFSRKFRDDTLMVNGENSRHEPVGERPHQSMPKICQSVFPVVCR